MMKGCKRCFILLLLVGSISAVAAERREGLWGLISFFGSTSAWLYDLQLQPRYIGGSADVNQSLVNLGAGRALSAPWQAWAGLTLQQTDQDAPTVAREYRLWEELDYRFQRLPFEVVVRSRLEERRAEGYTCVSNRLRERVLITRFLNDNWRLVIFNEFFFNLNQVPWITTPTFDQNRTFMGMEYQLTRSIRAGSGYLWRYLPTTPSQTDNILMLTLLVNIDMLN
ncbi:DUF2490 domain-containing protein [Legionella geestiana]|uniref:DUF2490 domain-containing protein n=1 Tax=Legionella geestiana TaxID=45065 RepID=UPI0010919443|nr:DUF2490 domain-containing protein [Legionella geestiana]QDQ39193.1 DUF2490 domain-containing protein [Legionella geestiana]